MSTEARDGAESAKDWFRGEWRRRAWALEAEVDAVAEVIHAELEDYGPDDRRWWLPAEPGPIECKTLADAVEAYIGQVEAELQPKPIPKLALRQLFDNAEGYDKSNVRAALLNMDEEQPSKLLDAEEMVREWLSSLDSEAP